MAQVRQSISIPGWDERLPIQSITIRQYFDQHHTFELTALVPEGYDLTVDCLRAILGEKAEICIERIDSGEHCRFLGIVDRVTPSWTPQGRTLSVEGYSPGILLDVAPRFRAFSAMGLRAVVDKVMEGYTEAFRRGGLAGEVAFSIQAQETDYNYLCRLADAFQMVFFYDGETMRFMPWGEQTATETIRLRWNSSMLRQGRLTLNATPLHFRLSGYELVKNRDISLRPPAEHAGHPLVEAAAAKSACYPLATVRLMHPVSGMPDLNRYARSLLARQANELVRIQCHSTCPSLRIGGCVRLEGEENLICDSDYVVTEVIHQVDSDNSYGNIFTAVPAGCSLPVRMHQGRGPISGPLMAVVQETNDPEKLGRVRVRFLGDDMQALSPWLRVLTPYTGNGGLFFLPEKGDQVVVFAEEFNAEGLPFVLGAFYKGGSEAGRWSDPANKIKGLATEKIRLLLDDNSGKLIIEANDIELVALNSMRVNGGRHLTQEADRIDLNP